MSADASRRAGTEDDAEHDRHPGGDRQRQSVSLDDLRRARTMPEPVAIATITP
jgi:hypothetical protein